MKWELHEERDSRCPGTVCDERAKSAKGRGGAAGTRMELVCEPVVVGEEWIENDKERQQARPRC